ncbi:MAG: cysteine--tRNA ligase [Candidatus Cloacimonetes bacterium 4572_55]|nr:MAG: cysteine--tRNA ligase [Candidatus Cloacimonetes bacterium 4572_55]
MHVFNRLTGKKEIFKSLVPNQVGMYICGMTVQDSPHIGHMRSFVTADIMRRYLEFRGSRVHHVQNFTDIDDKIIKRANDERVPYTTVADRYIREYFDVAEKLNLLRAHVYPKATEEIDAIIELIQKIIENGYGYEVDGDVFFSVEKFPKYGELSGRKTDELLTGTRFKVDPKKQSPLDFALWKSTKLNEPSWDSPFGKGRPGWHIECSAMAMKYLGETLDMHGGGLDLIFPHHENEKAQAESATGVPFVKYWVESGLLNIGGEKMSKSLGNFSPMNELLNSFSANEIRFFLISHHYRSPLEYNNERLTEAKQAFSRIENCVRNAYFYISRNGEKLEIENPEIDRIKPNNLEDFIQAMDNDFNTAIALSHIFDLVKETNIAIQSSNPAPAILEMTDSLMVMCTLLGFRFEAPRRQDPTDNIFNRMVDKTLEWRQMLRKEKNWAMADRIRDDLTSLGLIIEDHPKGSTWKWTK